MVEGRWEHFPHGADIGVRGHGPTRQAAFEQAALALTAATCDPGSVLPRQEVEIDCEAADEELLLAQWLNAIVYEMATRRMLFGRFAVAIDGLRLRGRAWGEPGDIDRHQPAGAGKGATPPQPRGAHRPRGRAAR